MEKGFIVFPTYKVEEDKAYVQLYGRLENGESFLVENEYEPYFYIKKKDEKKAMEVAGLRYEKSELKTFEGEETVRVALKNPKSVPEARKLLADNGIGSYEADVRFAMRYLIDNEIKSTISIEGKHEKGERTDRLYKNAKVKQAELFPELKLVAIDIETDGKAEQLYSIAMYGKEISKVLIVTDKKAAGAEAFSDEKSLLERFKELVLKMDPDVITGWNVVDFDLSVLREMFKKHDIKFDLGRNDKECRIIRKESFFTDSKAAFPGRIVLDGISMMKMSFVKLDNYKLDTAANAFAGAEKIFKGENRYKEVEKAYKEDIKKFISYNLMDAKLAYEIVMKSGVFELTITRSIITGIAMDRVRGAIASFDSLYLRELRKRKIIAITTDYNEKEERIKGGYVRDSIPGIYDNIIVLDFKSLYPSIIRTFNIDPYMYVDNPKEHKQSEMIEAPNGAFFLKKEGILPQLLQELWDVRDKAKKSKDELTSHAIKILMNSLFGVLANPKCRFFNINIANAITHFGQFLIKVCAGKIEDLGYEVIYGDTDSIFANSKEKNYKKAEKVGRELEEETNKFFTEYVRKEYGVGSYLQIEFEKVFKKFFMPKIRGGEKGAKKRYAGIIEKDGKEELEFTGLEFVRADWTEIAKEFQQKLLWKVLKDEKIESFIVDFVEEIKEGKHDNLLVYRKQIRKPVEEYVKTTPPHIKAARKIGRKGTGLIEYVMTVNGPEAVEAKHSRMDYEHYIEKQIKPIADSILVFFGKEFDEIMKRGKQSSLAEF